MNTSIIVCTYNEEATIFNVVAACCKHNPNAEVIVVNDGSTDNTEAILETLAVHYKFDYLKLTENKGTSFAMSHGAEYATGEVLLFLGADISEIRKEHFASMLEPIYNRKADLVIGTPSDTTINFKSTPYKSIIYNKAMLREDLLPILNDIREIRFSVESYILLHYQTVGRRVHFASLHGLKTPIKEKCEERLLLEANIKKDQEVATALLSNLDLINKRIQNNIQKTQDYSKATITSVQYELNKRMEALSSCINELGMV